MACTAPATVDANTNHPMVCATPILQASKQTEKAKSAATKVAKLGQPLAAGKRTG